MFVAIVVVVPALAVQGNGIPAFEKTTADAAGTTNDGFTLLQDNGEDIPKM